jgi:hypothetical protein
MERREPNLTPSRSLFREFVDDATGILISERREVTLKNLIWVIFGLDAFMILFLVYLKIFKSNDFSYLGRFFGFEIRTNYAEFNHRDL